MFGSYLDVFHVNYSCNWCISPLTHSICLTDSQTFFCGPLRDFNYIRFYFLDLNPIVIVANQNHIEHLKRSSLIFHSSLLTLLSLVYHALTCIEVIWIFYNTCVSFIYETAVQIKHKHKHLRSPCSANCQMLRWICYIQQMMQCICVCMVRGLVSFQMSLLCSAQSFVYEFFFFITIWNLWMLNAAQINVFQWNFYLFCMKCFHLQIF